MMIKAVVDSIYGDEARVLIGHEGVGIAIPVHQLPSGAREGTVMRVRFTIDQAATIARSGAKKLDHDNE